MLIEPVKPMKKKDLIRLDEEAALKLQVEFDEEERLAREKDEKEKKVNIALIETWDDIQAKIDDDHQLAERLQAQEQEELSIEEKATLFQQLLEKRRKHFAAKRAEEKRNKPPTKAQQRKIISFKRVNTFEDFGTELVEGKEKKAGIELIQENAKKQKVEDDKETAELKQCLEIIPDEEEVTIDAIPLAVKQDLEDLYKLVKAKYESTRPVDDLDLFSWGDLKTMFEPHVEDEHTGDIHEKVQETLMDDDLFQQDSVVDCQHDPYHVIDEEQETAEMVDKLNHPEGVEKEENMDEEEEEQKEGLAEEEEHNEFKRDANELPHSEQKEFGPDVLDFNELLSVNECDDVQSLQARKRILREIRREVAGKENIEDGDFFVPQEFSHRKLITDKLRILVVESRRAIQIVKCDNLRVTTKCQILIDVSVDKNNGIYPLAYAIVEAESIPCVHVMATMYDMPNNGREVGIAQNQVDEAYWLSTWREMYIYKVEPVSSSSFWPKCKILSILLTSHYHVPIGRPKKKRRVIKDDKTGHNKRTSTGLRDQQPTGKTKKNTRPKGLQDAEPIEVARGSSLAMDS
ncbi:hypothetical protein Tco_1154327 [Tanacetum coccineum]